VIKSQILKRQFEKDMKARITAAAEDAPLPKGTEQELSTKRRHAVADAPVRRWPVM
jgi:hypothetical protein